MSQRRDQLLQQLGITQWQLRRPDALKGLVGSPLLSTIRFVLLADPLPSLSTPLLQDVLKTLQLTEQQVHCCTPASLAVLPKAALYWSLGDWAVKPPSNMLLSPPLSELLSCAQAKRQLWQQICYYADHLSATV
ncbi:DNA polymerase III subunit psi [unidentified bacterial endosymbiont]|uniref:DNA polymerase III subunit psi n=1 Tax=unidentified bacterial endosymbiont TaxID=2355 RepID=UPI0020A221A4|nr:DNA polymerase III subunit psi [unidentified bacterial endosymbiont]